MPTCFRYLPFSGGGHFALNVTQNSFYVIGWLRQYGDLDKQLLLVVFALHVFDEVDDSVGVAHLVVVPGDELDKGGRQLNAGLGVKNGGMGIAKKVGGNHH